MQQLDLWPFPTNIDLETLEVFPTIKEVIEANHIRVVHLFDKFYPYGGTTVAYKPVKHDKTGYPTGKFGYVAVAYCNPKDRYDRKVGQQLAVEMLMDGQSILLPIYICNRPVVAIRQIFEDVLAPQFKLSPPFGW